MNNLGWGIKFINLYYQGVSASSGGTELSEVLVMLVVLLLFMVVRGWGVVCQHLGGFTVAGVSIGSVCGLGVGNGVNGLLLILVVKEVVVVVLLLRHGGGWWSKGGD